MLVCQQPSLISHVRNKYDQADKKGFEDVNAWFALQEIFIDILQDPNLGATHLIIDALDECVEGLPKLLDLIVKQSAATTPIKWIISSRNWPDIEKRLERARQSTKLSLELNAESVSKAVDTYIRHRVHRLAQCQDYNNQLQDAVIRHLSLKADGTFLWVALVCQNLRDIQPWEVLEALDDFPPGLDLLYQRMLEKIRSARSVHHYQKLLAIMMSLYRPIALAELPSLIDIPDLSNDINLLSQAVGFCGSFLTIRDAIVYFVHQSAKDFLLHDAIDRICPNGQAAIHYTIFTRSLHVMSNALQRDIYGVQAPGHAIEHIHPLDPDPLAALRYVCVFWVDHVCDWLSTNCAPSFNDWNCIETFIREKYLYWLEALSLCRSMPEGVLSIAKLYGLIQVFMTP
jgi:hypothetical protein